ncbi:MAG: class I SAM-dependent methyltransferase [Desulfobulbaceae bacterium]|nr:class I SAM-dependent methyltransferase [Desulfobulbaceae bacterium]
MSEQEFWQDRYQTGDTPWETGRPDFNLTCTVLNRPILPCRAIDIGCGTGTIAIWLAQKGFTVTGADISETAVQKARENAADNGVKCDFFTADFQKQPITNAPFGFAFDRGCFHSFKTDEGKKQFAENLANHLGKDGLWLSLSGNADDTPSEVGPPRISARDIVVAVEPWFEIISLTASYFDSNQPVPPMAWVCLMRKRDH